MSSAWLCHLDGLHADEETGMACNNMGAIIGLDFFELYITLFLNKRNITFFKVRAKRRSIFDLQ